MFADYNPTELQLLIVGAITVVGDIFGSVIGGGGFVIHPVLLAIGLPPAIALANDMTASAGAALSGAYVFHRHQAMNYGLVRWWLPGLLAGPVIGANLLALSPPWLLQNIVAFNAIVGGIILLKFSYSSAGDDDSPLPRQWRIYALGSGLLVGLYFGYAGAGAGVLIFLILIGVFKLGLRHSIGLKNIINLVPSLTAAITYLWLGLISPILFATMLGASLLGGYIGSHFIVSVGEKKLRKLFFICVLTVVGLMLFGARGKS